MNTAQHARLRIECQRGIGSAVISTKADWPQSLTIILPLAALEGFVVNADQRQFRLEITKDGDVIIEPDMKNPLSLVSSVEAESGRIYEVHIDLALLNTDESNILVSWVDYYR